MVLAWWATWGSSPLTRGKLRESARIKGKKRLIPAHAGKTGNVGEGSETVSAHPRSRGENLFIKSGSGANDGSSPLTRGKRGARGACDPWTRLIPTHAGKT